jgi:hypothetical protein
VNNINNAILSNLHALRLINTITTCDIEGNQQPIQFNHQYFLQWLKQQSNIHTLIMDGQFKYDAYGHRSTTENYEFQFQHLYHRCDNSISIYPFFIHCSHVTRISIEYLPHEISYEYSSPYHRTSLDDLIVRIMVLQSALLKLPSLTHIHIVQLNIANPSFSGDAVRKIYVTLRTLQKGLSHITEWTHGEVDSPLFIISLSLSASLL